MRRSMLGLLLILGLGSAHGATAEPAPKTHDEMAVMNAAIRTFRHEHPEAIDPAEKHVTLPELVKRVEMEIPEAARARTRPGGGILIDAIVDVKGNVSDAVVVRSENPDLNDDALRAVRAWKYKPALRRGRPVRVFMTVFVTIHVR